MRKYIYTIGFYVIFLSVFSFCTVSAYATPFDEIVPENALENLREMEGAVRDQRDEVQDA